MENKRLLTALKLENERLKKEMAGYIGVCNRLFGIVDHADFRNGNEAQGCDEGDVLARRSIAEIRECFDALIGEVKE